MMLLAAASLLNFQMGQYEMAEPPRTSYLRWHGADEHRAEHGAHEAALAAAPRGTGCAHGVRSQRLMTWFSSRRSSWRLSGSQGVRLSERRESCSSILVDPASCCEAISAAVAYFRGGGAAERQACRRRCSEGWRAAVMTGSPTSAGRATRSQALKGCGKSEATLTIKASVPGAGLSRWIVSRRSAGQGDGHPSRSPSAAAGGGAAGLAMEVGSSPIRSHAWS